MKKTLSSLAVITLLATPIVSMADTADSALIKGGSLNLREEATTEAKVLAQYPNGTLVEVVSSVNDAWAQVKVNGKSGYMMKKYLNTEEGNKTFYIYTLNGKGLNMRETPNMSSAIITSYKKGTSIKVLQKGINWSRVLMDGKEGFMSSDYLVSSMPSPTVPGKTAVVNNPKDTQVLNLRESASDQSKSIGQYKNGKIVQIVEKGDTWTKVTVDGKTGFMLNKFLKFTGSYTQPNFTAPESPYEVELINVNGTGIVNFRDGGSLNANIVRTYPVGTKVTVNGVSTDWLRVEIDGTTGYISRHFTKAVK